MKLNQILQSQAMRFITVSNPYGGNIYGVNLAKEFQSRYGFLEGPRNLADFNLANGVSFFHGYFKQEIVIDKCQIFQNGLLAESKASVEQCELFLDSILEWANEVAGLDIAADEDKNRGYVSQLEVVSEIDFSALEEPFGPVTSAISDIFSSYGADTTFGITGILLHADITSAPFPQPPVFSIMRRDGHPYTSNLYFSTAPFKTDDHLSLLELLEKSLA